MSRMPVVPFAFVALTACASPPAAPSGAQQVAQPATQPTIQSAIQPATAPLAVPMDAAVVRRTGPVPVDAATVAVLRGTYAAYETRRRVLLENIANVDTPAYRRRIVQMVMRTVVGSDGSVFQVPEVAAVVPSELGGALVTTGRVLDLAIDGNGWFAVVTANGSTGYTRNGALQITCDGKLATSQGQIVVPEITVPSDALEVSIDPEGRVVTRTAGNPDSTVSIGQLRLSRFLASQGLRPGDNVHFPTEASGAPITGEPGSNGLGTIKQGFLERSNVQVAGEMLELQALEHNHAVLVQLLQGLGYTAP